MEKKENRFLLERKAKIEDWKDLGFLAYAKDFVRTHTAEQATEEVQKNEKNLRNPKEIMAQPQGEIRLCGRIIAMREMGKLAFLSIRDVSGDFQIALAQEILGEKFKDFLKALDIGDYCGFVGEFFLTKHGEPSLMAGEVLPLSKSLRALPEKWHGLTDKEACYRERNLDLISNPESLERFKIRSQVVKTVRDFYEARDFVEVETSVLQTQAGGAMAKTFQTHHNALDHDFHLRIALELPLKVICSGGLERVFEIGKCFRNEGTDPSHLQEFTMLEWYAAYVSFEQNMDWNESMLREIAEKVFGKTKFIIKDKDEKEHEIDFSKSFSRIKFADLLKEYANLDMFSATDKEVAAKAKEVGVENIEGVGRANLLDDIYKKTARPRLIEPCFVLDYPEDLKPLATPNGDGTASSFQVLIAGWEVINAYGELIDSQVQRSLLEKQATFRADGDDEAMEVDEVFLKAMEHGFPPMAGQGMGIDRIVALLTGQDNLRDVVLFPTMRPEVSQKELTKNPPITKIPPQSTSKTHKVSNTSFPREKAWEMIESRCDWALQRHLAFVANSMESLAIHLGCKDQKDTWYITGLLHDIDWNDTIDNPDEHCGEATMQYLEENGVPEEIRTAIQTHHTEAFDLPVDTDLKKALLAADEISGFAVAVALMRPTKMIGISPKSIVKKMKDKQFAAAVDRAHMKYCETYFDMSVTEFLPILIPGWEAIASDWDLKD